MNLVLIEWLDSKGGPPSWEYIEEIEPLKPVVCLSVGFLIEDTSEYKTIVSTMSNSQVLGRLTIPGCSIINLELLREEEG